MREGELPGHKGGIASLVFRPYGQTLASVGSDNRARLWDVISKQEIQERQHKGVVTLAFGPDGKLLASGGEDGMVLFWGVPLVNRDRFSIPRGVRQCLQGSGAQES